MTAKISFVLPLVLGLFIFFCSPVLAVCPCAIGKSCDPADTWIEQWTDPLGQTTYTLEAPCWVYVGNEFTITATVTDSLYPNDWVGFGWSLRDSVTGVEASGFKIVTENAQWQSVFKQTYTGSPVDHAITFGFTDLGEGGSGHGWGGSVVGETTVDPYPPSAYLVKRLPDGINADYDMSPAEAYAKVRTDGQIIQCKAGAYGELVFDLPYAVELSGGYNADFSSNADSLSTITGFLELAGGSAVINQISIQ